MKKLLALLGTGGLTVATSSSLVACQPDTPTVYTKTIYLSTDTVQVEVGSTFRIIVLNAIDFDQVSYTYRGIFEEIASVKSGSFGDNYVDVTGLAVGTGTLWVVCEGAKDYEVSVEVVPKTIHLSTKEINVTNTFESFVQITNYSANGGFKVVSKDESIATANIDETNEEILIQGVSVGSTTLTVSATGLPSSTINVTVDENTKEITLTEGSVEDVIKLTKGASDTSITLSVNEINSSETFALTDVKVVSKDETIAKGSIDSETGVLKINALGGGEVSLYVTAVGAKPIEILIEVNENIIANDGEESVEVLFGYGWYVPISNYKTLGKITYEIGDGGSEYVSATYDEEGSIDLKGLKIGETTLTISARYMTESVTITVKVVEKYSR